jgi:hypothetical protein
MCVTSEITGKLKLRGDRTQVLAHLNEDRAQQWLPHQRRDVTYVSRLQAAQGAIDSQLTSLSTDHPLRTVGIVAFSSDVTIMSPDQDSKVVAGDLLEDYEGLAKVGREYALTSDIKKSREALSGKVFALEEGGQTALGPALVVSIAMAAQKRGSSVVVCTDGLSNVGLGSLDEFQMLESSERERVQKFYDQLATFAQTSGVSVSIVSIKGTEANLEQLGHLAELTGGTVNMIEIKDLTKNFGNILASSIIATHVSAKVLLHKGMFIRDAEIDQALPVLQKDIGNVTTESEVTFEYGVRPETLSSPDYNAITELPFQVLLYYTKMDGMRYVRVISAAKPVTHDRHHAELSADLHVLGVNACQQSAKAAQRGDYTFARVRNLEHRQLLSRAVRDQESSKEAATYMAVTDALEERLYTEQRQEFERGEEVDAEEPPAKEMFAKRRTNARTDQTAEQLYGAKTISSARVHKKK